MNRDSFVIGLDFGTDSCRAVVVNTANGEILGDSVVNYSRWGTGKYCEPGKNQFRQHPADYLEAMEEAITDVLFRVTGEVRKNIRGISAATTGSTVAPVDKEGVPLALSGEFKDNPNAMFSLWKDHTAIDEANEINKLAHSGEWLDYTKYVGGAYSAEWFWAKILHTIRVDEKVANAAYSWVEHCDWIPGLLTGNTNPLTLKRSRCAAGHKAMWHSSFGGLPGKDFLKKLDPRLGDLRDRLYVDTYTSDIPVGKLSKEWVDRLGLGEDVTVGVGALDAHMGAVGGGIVEGSLVKVMGTSSCDMIVVSPDVLGNKLVRGIAGQVDGSIIPGLIGLEAGQSAFGDVYAWFGNLLSWPLLLIEKTDIVDRDKSTEIRERVKSLIIRELDDAASKIKPTETSILALDWLNGRRSPFANQFVKGAISGLTLGSNAPEIFRALVEATAYGTKSIIERFEEEGIKIDNIIGIGGVAKKSPFVVQVMCDVINRKIKIVKTEQTVALGAAEFAAVASGIFRDISEAQQRMGSGFDREYSPDPHNVSVYNELYKQYKKFGAFIEKSTCK